MRADRGTWGSWGNYGAVEDKGPTSSVPPLGPWSAPGDGPAPSPEAPVFPSAHGGTPTFPRSPTSIWLHLGTSLASCCWDTAWFLGSAACQEAHCHKVQSTLTLGHMARFHPQSRFGCSGSRSDLLMQMTPECANITCQLSWGKPAFQRQCLPNGGIPSLLQRDEDGFNLQGLPRTDDSLYGPCFKHFIYINLLNPCSDPVAETLFLSSPFYRRENEDRVAK